ncbi:MAG: aminoglycoside phosphotransferase family protein [Asgard group archaeon]|nr:aminoglycoside phosphotransferase family protein [Asgard group archaeon]
MKMKAKKIIGKGRTADVFEWDDNKILKLFHKNYSNKYIQYEYDISKHLQDKLQFIPKVYDLIDYQEKQGIVFEKIDGISLLHYLMKNPFKIFKEMKQFAKLHVEIHKCEFMGFVTQIEFLKNDINRSKDLDEETKKKILNNLNNLPTADTLCHRDFHPDNVFFTTDGLIVFDWITACVGAPAGDVARTYYILGHAKPIGKLSIMDKIKIKFFQSIISRQYLKNYLKRSKLTKKEVKDWELVTISGRLAENIPEEKSYILNRINKLLSKN